MSLSVADFDAFHLAVHGVRPFDWQARLLGKIVTDRCWPRVLDLPTGTGKTTCVDIALFALALDATSSEKWCPRRIAMVVDRRVVVDQVAERGRKLAEALRNPTEPVVIEVGARLRSLTRSGIEPVGVFTLRGGVPKDDGWARCPDQPLVVASTVDQLGSRLLLQGYGVSRGMRPVHAGLLANDTLILLDEVHLSRPFAETLETLDRLRQRFDALPHRFQHAFLSATPGDRAVERFTLSERDLARDGPLGARLYAKKPARLVEVTGRSEVERLCVGEAKSLIANHSVIAVVLNRVNSAAIVARQLAESLGTTADVRLLTGRMRPLDRDRAMLELRPRILTGRDRAGAVGKLVIVATQCIEAGADFDFDAIITEAASLDALRQRFGRVDRLGLYGRSNNLIVNDKAEKDDPVYGEARSATVAWIKERLDKKSKQLDFGPRLLPEIDTDALGDLIAPTRHAPVMLPAYLDLWSQTAPMPAQLPDVTLWLHGPQTGPADVQVIWRADLREGDVAGHDPRRATEIVSAVRPTSLEAAPVPFAAAVRWLSAGADTTMVDTEGAEAAKDDEGLATKQALRWDGDDSQLISGKQLRPGDTIVVPSTRGGIAAGSFNAGTPPEPVPDLAEQAALFGRGQTTLRLNADVLASLQLPKLTDDLEATRDSLAAAAAQAEPGTWRALWLDALSKGRLVGQEQLCLVGKRIPLATLQALARGQTVEDGLELTTDEDDSPFAGKPVHLSKHSFDVETFARDFASAVGLAPHLIDDLALAGWLHDIGKADRRFQILLRGGSDIDYLKDPTPLAKSGLSTADKAGQRRAHQLSRYPTGARHELQSVAMMHASRDSLAAKATDWELVLHLVASHHGHCRPFAPAVADPAPVQVALDGHASVAFGTVAFPAVSSDHKLHALDAPIADRYWRLIRKYGWHELCWLEAILRLADHRASEAEQEAAE